MGNIKNFGTLNFIKHVPSLIEIIEYGYGELRFKTPEQKRTILNIFRTPIDNLLPKIVLENELTLSVNTTFKLVVNIEENEKEFLSKNFPYFDKVFKNIFLNNLQSLVYFDSEIDRYDLDEVNLVDILSNSLLSTYFLGFILNEIDWSLTLGKFDKNTEVINNFEKELKTYLFEINNYFNNRLEVFFFNDREIRNEDQKSLNYLYYLARFIPQYIKDLEELIKEVERNYREQKFYTTKQFLNTLLGFLGYNTYGLPENFFKEYIEQNKDKEFNLLKFLKAYLFTDIIQYCYC